MRVQRQRWAWLWFMLLASAGMTAPFQLRDYLGRDWRHECVQFPLTAAQLQQAQAGQALVGEDGNAVAYQVVTETVIAPILAFHVDLPPYAARAFDFTTAKAAVKTDLVVEETADTIRLANALTGIVIRKRLTDGNGPVARVRLQSGAWVGGSRLSGGVTGYTAKLTARGPVFAEVACTTTLGEGSTWTIRFRLNAGEPVVLVEEHSAVAAKGAAFQLDLQQDFSPNKIFYRIGKEKLTQSTLTNIGAGMVFVLEPWLHWWERPNQGLWFGLLTIDEPEVDPDGPQLTDETVVHPDLLSVAARDAGLWVNPGQPAAQPQAAPNAVLINDGNGLHLDFALRYGQRKWIISALKAEQCLRKEKRTDADEEQDEDAYAPSPLPQQYLIKHGHFPLDVVKDYVLAWDNTAADYPHMLFTRADGERLRARVDPKPYQRAVASFLTPTFYFYNVDRMLETWYATGDERLGRQLVTMAAARMQQAVEVFTQQRPVTYGCAPHHIQLLGDAMTLADAALGSGQATPEMRTRLLAQAAFIAYAVDRPEFWSPARGYSANPNMTTTVNGYLIAAACLVNTHPRAKRWAEIALWELRDNELHNWSDANGGWLEAPHYAMVSYDQILGALVMAYNSGISDALYTDPKVKSVINWFSKISTPPNAKTTGMRHLPAIGNTYMHEPCGEYGVLAFLFREKDPEFSAQMQWMHRQHKSWPGPGIGGGYPAMAGYRALLLDPTLPEKAPAWTSEFFPNTAYMLRNGFPDPRETQLLLLTGAFGGWRSHWDDDSGSITMWGKGRIVANDFGYYGMAPGDDHNLVQSPLRGGVLYVKQHAESDTVDYVDGTAGGWRRQIAMVKDADLLGPNYFVMCDSFAKPVAATWRLWLTAEEVLLTGPGKEMIKRPDPIGLDKEDMDLLEEIQAEIFVPSRKQSQHALAVGTEDVDTDIFFARPAALVLNTEEKTKTANCGVDAEGNVRAMPTTQIGVIASVKDCDALTSVLYPRLKTDKAPIYTPLADGRGVKVQHAAGTDYVFVSPTPVVFRDGDIAFDGTVGAILLRGPRTVLSLSAPGSLAARGHTLTDDKAVTREWPGK